MSSDRRYAIVTGSANGLGRALAVRLARDGWHLALLDIDESGNRETLDLVRRAGGDGQLERLDVSDRHAWMPLVAKLRASWPQLDLLANNAGVAGSGELGRFTLDDWDWLLSTNVFGVVYGCHSLIDWLKANPHGAHIINTASMAGIAAPPSMAAYNLSKAAVIAFSETLYGELAKYNVGVTVLCPLFFASNLLVAGRFDQPQEREFAARAMERAGFTSADVAEAAIRAMRRKQLYVVIPRRGRIYWRLKRAVPALFHRFLADEYKKGVPKT